MTVQEFPSQEDRLEQNIKLNTYHGVAQALTENMFKPFIGIYAITMGASNFEVAMLSSLPAVVSSLVMLPGTKFINRATNKKALTAGLFLFNRFFYLVAACVPFLPLAYRSMALVLAVGLMNLPGAIATVAWQSLIGKIIPASLRGEAFARRNQMMGIGSLLPTLGAGYLLDYLPSPFGYQVVLGAGFAFAIVEAYIFLQVKELDFADPESGSENTCSVKDLLAERKFFIYMMSSLVFYFGWQMAWPLFTLYQVNTLGANNSWMALNSAILTVVSIGSYHWWGKRAATRGNYSTLVLATFGMAISPIMVALSPNLWILSVFTIVMGFFTAGTVLILFNAMLDTAPECMRTSCVAYYNTLINVSATIAPFVGSYLLEFTSIYNALIVAAVFRGLGSLAFHIARKYVPETS